MTDQETVFTYGAPALKFGDGASDEIGHDLAELGCHRVLVITDPRVAATGMPQRIAEKMADYGVTATVYDRSRVEPTDESLQAAVDWARDNGPWDAFVAVGGGSSIDTAKAVDLLLTNPGQVIDYVNAPVGGGRSPANPLLPLVAVPTTTGTGSESTTVCVLDVLAQRVKSGISHWRLRPSHAVVDPMLTVTQPAGVTAASGMDILAHALESYTARPYTALARKRPEQRVAYCGANPISDMWAEKSLSLLAEFFRRAVRDGDDLEARRGMAQAATFAGLGFGNAGVHLPHGMSYPVSARVRGYQPPGYPTDHPLIPHGMSVILHAPAVFRFTAPADPARHLEAARLLGAETRGAGPDDAGEILAGTIVAIMRRVGVPNGLAAVGFDEADVDALVTGTVPQHRVTKLSPRPAAEPELRQLFLDSMRCW